MHRVANRGLIAMVLVLALAAGMVFFFMEYATKAEDWVMFTGSPHVYSGGKLSGGTVTDRTGTRLLDLSGGRTYASSAALRKAMLHWTGDREGNILVPALSEYADEMLGYNVVNGVYAPSDDPAQLTLTLIASVQQTALEAMGSRHGTVAVYNYKTGEILCAVSTPVFDPDNVPDIAADQTGKYSGVYVNRFTQSVYIPGSIFKIVTLAAALETIADVEGMEFPCSGEMEISGSKVTCEHKHGDQNLKKAFANSCNCAFAQLAQLLGRQTLQQYAEKFGVADSITFDGITTAAGHFDTSEAYGVSLAWAAIGQYTDQINPCGFMTFMGAVASGGRGAMPHVVASVHSGGRDTYEAKTEQGNRIMSVATATALREYMAYAVEYKYGADNFGTLTVCAKTGTAEVGGGKKPNAMFAGFVADESYPWAFIVAVEDGGYGQDVCVPIISKVLQACVEAQAG